jgi:hypothetical protein
MPKPEVIEVNAFANRLIAIGKNHNLNRDEIIDTVLQNRMKYSHDGMKVGRYYWWKMTIQYMKKLNISDPN